jgi:hypothetical protein
MADDMVRTFAGLAVAHEIADEGWKAAVARGQELEQGAPRTPGDETDAIAAIIWREKDRLIASMSEPAAPAAAGHDIEALRFELAAVRGRMESLETALDALLSRLDKPAG